MLNSILIWVREVYDRIIFRIKNYGFLSLLRTIFQKSIDYLSPPRSKLYGIMFQELKGIKGLEIGGPSKVFLRKGYLPLYSIMSRIDNVNFSSNTIWEGEINKEYFHVDGKIRGKQFIRDATNLYDFKECTYDIILSSEMIQHIANPLKALFEWKRVLKIGGYLLLIVPDMEKTFDHRRKLTSLEHLIDDYNKNTGEDDLTHLSEVLKYHDLSRDRLAGSFDQFKKRCENNAEFRAIHHHTFNLTLLIDLLNYANLKVKGTELFKSNILIIGQLNES